MTTKRWYGSADLEKRYGRLTFGCFLRAFRESEGVSQSEFADRLNLSRANTCDLEKERKVPSPERAAKIAKILGVSEKLLIQLAIQDSLRLARLNYTVELKVA